MDPVQLKEAVKFDRLKKMFTAPDEYWDEVVDEPGDLQSLLVPQMLILAAIPAVATFMGMSIRLAFILPAMGVVAALISGALTFALNLGIWLALGAIINQLADAFDARKDQGLSFKLAAGAIIPVWLGGSLWILPVVGHMLGPTGSLAGLLYGCYFLHRGLPRVNGTPADKALVYTVSAMAILFVLFLFLSWMTFCPASCLVFSQAARIGAMH
jgi:hypothetical protein